MKWKVENWGYSELEAGELEQHLNDMAGKGYILRWASSSGIHNASDCWARFDKTGKKKKYAVDVFYEGDEAYEDYLAFCRDAGWSLKAHLNNRLCIFEAETEKERPLYVDDAARFDQLAEYADQRYGISSPMNYIMLMVLLTSATAAGFYVSYKMIGWWYMIMWFPLWLYGMRYCANLTYICRLVRRNREDRDYRKPKVLVLLNHAAAKTLSIYCILAAVIPVVFCREDFGILELILIAVVSFSPIYVSGIFLGYRNQRIVRNVILAIVFIAVIIWSFTLLMRGLL